jgi:hypothetical protein
MIGRLILLDHLGGRPAAAKLLDGRLEDLLFEGIGPCPRHRLSRNCGPACERPRRYVPAHPRWLGIFAPD